MIIKNVLFENFKQIGQEAKAKCTVGWCGTNTIFKVGAVCTGLGLPFRASALLQDGKPVQDKLFYRGGL